ncbi:hypothetical protein L6452_01393 [Arctium lappa]|uniref:Uncharacterized protein n=1 Tax=Arctium lappa TaxID=4217 RepID=A0ACB9FHF3_ARCLA|nr:hypothetical protein L6452_01393 [Arctium lappa]
MSPISLVLTITTPPTAGDAHDDVDMTRVKRRTVYKKKPAAKKKKRQAKELKIPARQSYSSLLVLLEEVKVKILPL